MHNSFHYCKKKMLMFSILKLFIASKVSSLLSKWAGGGGRGVGELEVGEEGWRTGGGGRGVGELEVGEGGGELEVRTVEVGN